MVPARQVHPAQPQYQDTLRLAIAAALVGSFVATVAATLIQRVAKSRSRSAANRSWTEAPQASEEGAA
jgi:hypothetical protein